MKYLPIVSKHRLFSKEAGQFLLVGALFLFVSIGSFGLGRLSGLAEGRGRLNIHQLGNPKEVMVPMTATTEVLAASEVSTTTTEKNFVASKNGTKYYGAGCTGVSRIKVANQVWFARKEDAEAAGYTPAANCSF